MTAKPRPDFAVGSPLRQGPGDFTRPCDRCGVTVYMRDRQAFAVGKALCLPCFIVRLDETPTDEKIQLVLPPGVTPESMLAYLKGERQTPFLS